MGRGAGIRNHDFDEKREVLVDRLSRVLVDEDGQPASLGAMARAVGVTVPTLKHYFVDHDGVIAAALDAAERAGRPHLEALAEPGRQKLERSMAAVAGMLIEGWPRGLGALFAAGLAHGLSRERRGQAMVTHVLEPTIQGLEQRLAIHRARGEIAAKADLRALSLTFLSPLLLALLHQRELHGVSCRPLDVSAFTRAHVDGWLRAWASPPR